MILRVLVLTLFTALSALAQRPMQYFPFMVEGNLVTDWSTRVVANGGAMPSQNTIQAMETLRLGCISAGLTSKIYSLCIFVPDSVIASATPLFRHKGHPMWTNNFVSGDLTINGLKGDGSSKAMDTGCMAKALASGGVCDTSDGSRGLTIIVTESSTNLTEVQIGYRDADDDPEVLLGVSTAGQTQFLPSSANAAYRLGTNDWARVGYVSANIWNDANTNNSIYVASPLEAHKVVATKVLPDSSPAVAATATDGTISVFAFKHGTTNLQYSAQRLSMAMVNDGLTASESATLWSLFRACRETLGGGTGDNVHDWNRRIVNAGGANISTTTSNAMRTFYAGLDTDDNLYSMVAVNAYVPDSLTAARTPIIWQAGSQYWTNFNFGETNVSVNGLTGDGSTKYLSTGLNPVIMTNRGISATSAGVSVLIYNVPASSTGHILSGTGTAANSIFASPINNAGALQFFCWKFVTVNTEFVSRTAPSPGATWEGYLSGNRTAATAIRLDWVTNGVHNVSTNGTGTQTGSSATITNMYAFANHPAGGTPGNFSDLTISFIAVHNGRTQTQSSNLWNRVFDLRTALGGGLP